MAASAPPNAFTRARKVAGPTFSLRISRSQARRCRRLSRAPASAADEALALFANSRLLAACKAADIFGMANVENAAEQREQCRKAPLTHRRKHEHACRDRR